MAVWQTFKRSVNVLRLKTLRELSVTSAIIGNMATRAPFQYPIRRLIVRSRKVSKPRDLYLELSDRSEIWQAPRQQCCRGACQISKRHEHFNTRSRAFETLRDLTIRRLIGYRNGAQSPSSITNTKTSLWSIWPPMGFSCSKQNLLDLTKSSMPCPYNPYSPSATCLRPPPHPHTPTTAPPFTHYCARMLPYALLYPLNT